MSSVRPAGAALPLVDDVELEDIPDEGLRTDQPGPMSERSTIESALVEREGRARTRTIRITTTGQPVAPESRGARPSASSVPSVDPANFNVGNGFGSRNLRTVGDPADGSPGETAATVRANPLKNNIETEADGADENHPPQSAPEIAGWRARL